MNQIPESSQHRIPGSYALIHLTDDDTLRHNHVYMLYTAVRETKDAAFITKLEAIYSSHKRAQAALQAGLRQIQHYGVDSGMDDISYFYETGLRCVSYYTPAPEEHDKVFWAWTEEKEVL